MRLPSALLCLAVLACTLAACLDDAERGNPFDPRSDHFLDAGEVVGAVVRASRPSEGVPGATVHLSPTEGGAELVARASSSGAFSLAGVPTGTYALSVEAPGYAPADTTVAVVAGQPTAPVELRLNAVPVVTEQNVHTERINRNYPPPEIFVRLVVEATVADPDGLGDLASVDFVIPDFGGFRAPLLAVTGAEGGFRRTFNENELPVGLQDFLGRNLFIEVTDQAGVTARGEDTHVTRIVESIPVALTPQIPAAGGDPVSLPFEMTWAPLTLPYAFTWRIEIFLFGQSTPVLALDGLPPTQTSMLITASLFPGAAAPPPGDYQWFVSAVDAFGNLARSREAGFRLQ